MESMLKHCSSSPAALLKTSSKNYKKREQLRLLPTQQNASLNNSSAIDLASLLLDWHPEKSNGSQRG